MECPKCKNEVPNGEKFCGKCGAEMPEFLYVCPKCFKGYNEERKFYMSQRTFFLTYPHCDLEKIQVFNWYMIKHKPKILIVSKETHLDGSPHIHVWIQYEKKITIRKYNYFDINEYHCNIGKMKEVKD